MLIPDGFPGQRLRVLPRPLVTKALDENLTRRLLVTDAGHYPRARHHGFRRKHGCENAIVILCVSGRGWCRLNDIHYEIRPSQVVVIPPGTPHTYGANQDDPWTIWWAHLAGEDVPDLLRAARVDAGSMVFHIGDLSRAQALAESLLDHIERDETESSLIAAAGAAWHLMAHLASARISGAGDANEPMRRVRELLRENLSKHYSLSYLAEISGYSTSHFSARFKATTGYNVTEYVKRLRMARARELLDTTDSPVVEVAHEIGFDDAFYFSRQFRAVAGVSPTQFRRRLDR